MRRDQHLLRHLNACSAQRRHTGCPAALLSGGAVLPEATPAGGLLILRGGDPGAPEITLAVRKRRARRKAVGIRAPILTEARPNARWSLDFLHDQFSCGRRFCILNVVDDVTRECIGAFPDVPISGRRVANELSAIVERRGKPGMIVSDHGTELTSNAIFA